MADRNDKTRMMGPQRGKPGRQPAPAQARKKPAGYYDEHDLNDYDYERSAKIANRGCLVAFALVVVVLLGVLLGVYLYVSGEINGRNATAAGTVTLDVPPGSGGQIVAGLLQDAGLIGSDNIFRFYVRFNGAGSGFQQGKFELQPGISYAELINTLSQPPPAREEITIMIPEGSTVRQFAARFAEAGLCTIDEFVEMANNGDFSDIAFFSKLDYDPNTFMRAEGYLAPDTYNFFTDDSVESIVRKLFTQFNTNIEKDYVIEGFYDRMEKQGMTLRQVVTLASIVEEECSSPAEQANVAGVFWNRITKQLPADMARRTLGSDATQRYLMDWVSRGYGSGPDDFTDMTLAAAKDKLLGMMPADMFYAYYTGDGDANTREGLTAGPISSPSKTALEAALYPTNHEYFYFLSDDAGNYYYARTFAEHEVNIQRMYQANAEYAQQGGGDD